MALFAGASKFPIQGGELEVTPGAASGSPGVIGSSATNIGRFAGESIAGVGGKQGRSEHACGRGSGGDNNLDLVAE